MSLFLIEVLLLPIKRNYYVFSNRYLFIPNVLSAAVSRECTMLHPGYGFLAENATFVDMCKEHGINFIGPNVSTSCWNMQ